MGVLAEATYGHGSFNRTFMELKLNSLYQRIEESDSFNRTFMELKFDNSSSTYQGSIVSIVHLWN